jgi:hypothetical protein
MVKICRQEYIVSVYGGIIQKKICVWGHVCEAVLLLYLGGQPAPDLNLHGWLLTRPESGRLLRINAVGDAEFLEPGGGGRSRAGGQAGQQAFLEQERRAMP